jgi:hypothetical protein
MKIKVFISVLLLICIATGAFSTGNTKSKKKYLTGTVNVDYPVKIEVFKGNKEKRCNSFFNETITEGGEDYSISIPHTGYAKIVFYSRRSTKTYYIDCSEQYCTIDVPNLK